jgi:hypothetical protein
LKLQVLLTVSWVSDFIASLMKLLTSSNDLKKLLVYFLLKKAQIFSAGFSSGEYGGKKINPIFSGITKALDL